MWFLFGFITLISFSVYFGLQRYKANWKGESRSIKGIRYQYKAFVNKGNTNKILIGCDVIDEVCFAIKIEKWWDKFFKSIGVSVEHQVGVDEFDNLFYLITDNQSLCSLFSGSVELQESAQKIKDLCSKHGLKFKKLLCRHGRIWLELVPKHRREEPDVTRISLDIVPVLKKVSDILKNNQSFFLDEKHDPFIIKAMIILAISTGLAINGAVHLYRIIILDLPFIVDNTPLFQASLPWGLGMIGLLIFATLFFLGRTARTHLVLIELFLIGSFGAITTSYMMMRDINIDMDTGSPEYYSVTVHDKRISRSRNNTTHYIKVDDWTNNKKGRVELTVSSEIYYRFARGQMAKIIQMPGYMGYAWVSDIVKSN
jgi:hypothetical protein